MLGEQFRQLKLAGSNAEIGRQHGEALKPQIEAALEFYLKLFALSEAQIFQQVDEVKKAIAEFNPAYAEEIEAIAQGAAIAPEYIYLLNARSEILNNLNVPECTTVFNQPTGLLAQNWDWSEALEPLITLLQIEQSSGHKIATLTEPGILAKVGINNHGLAVSLNILKSQQRLRGLPVHVLLRAILDCRHLDEVQQLVEKVAVGKASHVLVADARGDYLCLEFAGDSHFKLKVDHHGLIVHTNHYLADESLNQAEAFPSTRERYFRAQEMLAYERSDAGVRNVLLDQSEGLSSICRPYSESALANFGRVGTVMSLMMKPAYNSMQVRPGCHPQTPFYDVAL